MEDIEREDALDILSLLVERSVQFDVKSKVTDNTLSRDGEARGGNRVSVDVKKEESPFVAKEKTLDDVQKCLNYFRECSSKQISPGDSEDGNDGFMSHEERLKLLDELEQSYIYANEMRSASLSAQTWLRSVGRPSSSLKRGKDTSASSVQVPSFFNDESPSVPRSFRQQLKEKDDLNNRLNQELSKCRAEIGRLKTMKRNEVSVRCKTDLAFPFMSLFTTFEVSQVLCSVFSEPIYITKQINP